MIAKLQQLVSQTLQVYEKIKLQPTSFSIIQRGVQMTSMDYVGATCWLHLNRPLVLPSSFINTIAYYSLSKTDKISNISGFHVSRWITSHGLALNCNVDLDWFDHIVACGLVGKGITSLSVETWTKINVQKATAPFIESFEEVFGCQLTQVG
jgi:hypothetical protein